MDLIVFQRAAGRVERLDIPRAVIADPPPRSSGRHPHPRRVKIIASERRRVGASNRRRRSPIGFVRPGLYERTRADQHPAVRDQNVVQRQRLDVPDRELFLIVGRCEARVPCQRASAARRAGYRYRDLSVHCDRRRVVRDARARSRNRPATGKNLPNVVDRIVDAAAVRNRQGEGVVFVHPIYCGNRERGRGRRVRQHHPDREILGVGVGVAGPVRSERAVTRGRHGATDRHRRIGGYVRRGYR